MIWPIYSNKVSSQTENMTLVEVSRGIGRDALKFLLPLLVALVAVSWLLNALPAPLAQADTNILYVSPQGNDVNDCRSRETMCRTPQTALTRAADGEMIQVAQGVYTMATGTVAYITKSVTIQGGWNEDFSQRNAETFPTRLDGQGLGATVIIKGAAPYLTIAPTVEGFTITGGNGTGVSGCTAPDATGCGGGVFSRNATPRLLNNLIVDNMATTTSGKGYGGGVYIEGIQPGTLLSGNQVISNVAAISSTTAITGFGGGIALYFIEATIDQNVIAYNLASDHNGWGYGGGLYLLRSPATLSHNQVLSNTAGLNNRGLGGGISLYQCRPDPYGCNGNLIQDNLFQGNIASVGNFGQGGGIQLGNTTVFIRDNTLRNNVASLSEDQQGDGGAVFGLTGDWTLRNNQVIENIASTGQRGFGGGFQFEYGQITVEGNTFNGNVANAALQPIPGIPSEQIIGYGGAVNVRGCVGACLMKGNTVSNNTASQRFSGYGGGISVRFEPITLDSNLIIDNRTTGEGDYLGWGGGVRVDRTKMVTLTNNIIAGNYARSSCGGVHIWGTDDGPVFAQLAHNTIVNNNSGPHQWAKVGVYIYGHVTAFLQNNILAGHSYALYANEFEGNPPQITATYNLYHDNSMADTFGEMINESMTQAPPGFVDAAHHNYHLREDSAAYRAGQATFVKYDFEGDRRPSLGYVDIGADELHPVSEIYLPLIVRN